MRAGRVVGRGWGMGVVGSWLAWETRQVAAHWRQDVRRGFLFGVSVGGAALAWLGLA